MKPLLQALAEILPNAQLKKQSADPGSYPPQETLLGDPATVRKAIGATPNTSAVCPSRDSYVEYGIAVKAALAGQPDAFDVWWDWCERWTDGTPNYDWAVKDWAGMKPPFRVGASYLYGLAHQHSGGAFDRAEVWFDQAAADFDPLPFDTGQNPEKVVKAPEPIKWVNPIEWRGRQPAEREWEVVNWIPRGEVTLLYGDGGIGKTLLAHLYATAAACGVDWLGQQTRPARVMCFFCEDSEDELHRRQIDICAALGVTLEDCADRLRIASRKYMDNLLSLWDRNTGAMKRQAVWDQLRADAIGFGADVVVIDTIADTYGGNEIDRGQVNAFVKSCLGALAKEIGGSVIALGHPSQAGKASGEGTSGSTAWSNAARSRLFLRYPKGVSKGNIRELEGMKLNYGPKGSLLKLRWARGAFEVVAGSVGAVASGTAGAGVSVGAPAMFPTVENATEAAVLDALSQCLDVPMNMKTNSTRYAPRVLRARAGDILSAFNADEVATALERLELRGAIKAVTVGRDVHRRPLEGFTIVDNMSATPGILD